LFFRDGRVIGLSGVLRSPRIALGISVEKRGLEIAGLESRSGLIMGVFTSNSGHEGRRVWQGALNVGSSAFHEGRGAGKKTTPGGHGLVNRKNCFGKRKVTGKSIVNSGKGRDSCDLGIFARHSCLVESQRAKFNGRPGESMNWE